MKLLKESIVSGLLGGIFGAIPSGLFNYYLIPFPQSLLDNAIGHSISGFISGYMAGFIGVLICLYRLKKHRGKDHV